MGIAVYPDHVIADRWLALRLWITRVGAAILLPLGVLTIWGGVSVLAPYTWAVQPPEPDTPAVYGPTYGELYLVVTLSVYGMTLITMAIGTLRRHAWSQFFAALFGAGLAAMSLYFPPAWLWPLALTATVCLAVGLLPPDGLSRPPRATGWIPVEPPHSP